MTEAQFERYCTHHLVRGVAKEALRKRWISEGKLDKPVPPKAEFKPLDPELEGILLEEMSLNERAQYLNDKQEYEAKKQAPKNVYQRGMELLAHKSDPKPQRPEDYEGYTYIKPKPRKLSEKVDVMSDDEIDALAEMKDGALDS